MTSAIRLERANSEYLGRVTDVLDYNHADGYEIGGWVSFASLGGSDHAPLFMVSSDDTGGLEEWDAFGIHGATNEMFLRRGDPIYLTGVVMAADTWYWMWFVANPTDITLYVDDVVTPILSQAATQGGRAASTRMWLGTRGWVPDRFADARFHGWRARQGTPLDAAGRLAEKQSPVSVAAAWADWRTPAGPTRGNDFLAGVRHWTEIGTLSDEDGPIYTEVDMSWVTGDRVKETTTTTGTGPLTLAGAVSAFRAFSVACIDGDQIAYAILGGTEWEVGLGHWGTGNILNRDKVFASSNAGALVNLSAGTKEVWCDFPARYGLLPPTARVLTEDVTLPMETSVYVADEFEIQAGNELELGVNAVLEVG